MDVTVAGTAPDSHRIPHLFPARTTGFPEAPPVNHEGPANIPQGHGTVNLRRISLCENAQTVEIQIFFAFAQLHGGEPSLDVLTFFHGQGKPCHHEVNFVRAFG